MAGAFGAIFHSVGAFRNKNRQVTACAGSQVAGLTASTLERIA